MDRLEAMAVFVAVADLQGFAPAARRMGLSPSAVTRLVAGLEEHLDTRLLQRTTRSVTLTDAGTRYLERARRILGDVAEAEGPPRPSGASPPGDSWCPRRASSGASTWRRSCPTSSRSTRR